MYCLYNCIPAIWGGSGTIEWRLHSPTQNPKKILNWLFICNAIMAYAEKYKKEISDFSSLQDVNLNSIFADVYSSMLASTLNFYVQWRKDYMMEMDATGEKELEEDLTLEIPYSVIG